MKIYNKIIYAILIIAVVCSITMNSYAAELKTKLEVVNMASDTLFLSDDQGYMTKKIVDSNPDTGEVTIELKVSNVKKEQEKQEKYENTEIYILVDENISRKEDVLAKYIEHIEKLSNSILAKNSNTKIGIIGMNGTIHDAEVNEDGKLETGPEDENEVDGSYKNAEIVEKFTTNVEEIKNKLNKMNPSKKTYNTNLQAAVALANANYSEKTNKVLISLYDGVPGISNGVHNKVSYGGWFGPTVEEAVAEKHEKIVQKTKEEILNLKKSNVSFIQLRPKDTSYDETWYNTDTGEKTLDFDGSPYVKELYGTMENPVYGKMYSLAEEDLETIVTKNIYEDLLEIIQADMKKVNIVDYFPTEIVENFSFSYVGKPNTGKISESIDTKTKKIEWNIENLKGNEEASLKYKLKIKDMKNEDLLNKVISTNDKVEISYENLDAKICEAKLLTSPSIKLTEIKEETPKKEDNNDNNENKDNNKNNEEDKSQDTTIAAGNLPYTGLEIGIGLFIGLFLIMGIFTYTKYKKLKDF